MDRHRSRSMSSTSSGRGVQSTKWDGRSGHRLHVSDLAEGISRKEIERAFAKYGSINEVWVATNPPCFAFINFTHRDDAEKALREVDGKTIGTTRVGVTWARERTFGGRNRGTPYGSYRSGGGGGGGGGGNRRRSRSRSRSNSRREKRRRSRSRSPDRHRRRSKSPRDRKRSHRTSKEKNGNGRQQESPNPSKNENRSRDSPPPSTTRPVENNTQNRSPIVIDSE